MSKSAIKNIIIRTKWPKTSSRPICPPLPLPLGTLFSDTSPFVSLHESGKHLLTFEAELSVSEDDIVDDRRTYMSALSALLADFSNLRCLDLSVNFRELDDALRPRSYARLFFLADCFWPHLDTLKLHSIEGCWTVTLDVWINFFDRHAPTLPRLDLDSFYLVEENYTWVDVAEWMSQNLLALETAHFSNLHEPTNGLDDDGIIPDIGTFDMREKFFM